MTQAKRKLKKVNVSFISLVNRGANKKIILYKNSSSVPTHEKIVSITKINEEQRIVYGIVYSPDEVDSQGDTADAEVIKEMAYGFMKNAKTNNVDKQHNFTAEEGYVAESWLLKEGDPVFPYEKTGSWAVGIKVENEETWQAVKSGGLTGLSLAGVAVAEEVEKSYTGFWRKVKTLLGVNKNFALHLKERKLQSYVAALEETLYQILNDETLENKRSAILEVVEEFTSILTESTKDTSLQKQEEVVDMKPEEIEALVSKLVEEALKPLTQKAETLKQQVEEITGELLDRVEKIEKATPGSRQLKKEIVNSKQNSIWI